MSLDASELTALGSVLTAAQAAAATPGGILQITSTGLTLAVTNAFGPVTNIEVIAGAFPGFGGPPPTIATASATGVAATASHSDHTHAADLPVYAPSLAGMQAAGIVTQTYAAPNATPVVVVATADRVLYGAHAATSLPTTSPTFLFNDSLATPTLAVTTNGGTVTPGTLTSGLAQIWAISEGAGSIQVLAQRYSAATGVGATIGGQRARGTYAAPLAVADNDALVSYQFGGHNGTSFQNPVAAQAFVDTTFGPIANAELPGVFQLLHLTNTTTTGYVSIVINGPVSSQSAGGTQQPTIALGTATLGTADTTGHVYLVDSAGIPAGAPLVPRWRATNNTRTAVTSIPTSFNSGNLRWYAFMGAAWHFSQFMDYDPGANAGRIPFVGATTHTLADSAAMTFASASRRLTLGTTGVGVDGSLNINAGAAANGISTGAGGGAFIYVADPNGGGAANIAVDDYYFGQALIGYTNTALSNLTVGVGGANTLLTLGWAMTRTGTNTVSAQIDGNNGKFVLGAPVAGNPVLQAAVGAPGDLMLGWNGGLVAGSTAGYPYLPSLPQRPTGAPNAFAGGFAVGVDLTTASGHALWIRNPTGAQWEPIPTFINSAAAGAQVAALTNLPAAVASTTTRYWVFKDSTGTATYIPFWQ